MNFLLAVLAWLIIGAILVVGIVMAVKGSAWFMIVGLLAFLFAFSKWGCTTH